jgi:hypothetical protein
LAEVDLLRDFARDDFFAVAMIGSSRESSSTASARFAHSLERLHLESSRHACVGELVIQVARRWRARRITVSWRIATSQSTIRRSGFTARHRDFPRTIAASAIRLVPKCQH